MDTIKKENSDGSQLQISDYAAHVLSWKNTQGLDRLFVSSLANFAQGKAIRGGVPIIFPQFNEFGNGPRHGFARNQSWQRLDTADQEQPNSIKMTLSSNKDLKQLWPYSFNAIYTVTFSNEELCMELTIENTDEKDFSFTAALHTYFAITSLKDLSIKGCKEQSYWNNDGSEFTSRNTEENHILRVQDAIDRVYFDVKKPLSFLNGNEELSIAMQGFKDVVVWNPGAEGAKQLEDFHDNEYQKMICIEAAVIDSPVKLEPGKAWSGSQTVSAS